MPCLYALGQHEALQAAHAQLQPGEYLFAYLDDVYVVCRPERAREVYDIVRTSIANHAYVQVNQGKTKMFNRAGVRPPRCDDLFHSDRDPVWVGDQGLPTERQGLMVLGSPLGTAAYVRASLADKFAEHDQLLQALGHMEDLQAAWLIGHLKVPMELCPDRACPEGVLVDVHHLGLARLEAFATEEPRGQLAGPLWCSGVYPGMDLHACGHSQDRES